MELTVTRMYPQVVRANQTTTLHLELSELNLDVSLLKIKIVPMEQCDIQHTDFHINELYRYPFEEFRVEGEGKIAIDHTFNGEQRHNVRVYYDNKLLGKLHVYSVAEDLAKLNCYKGDTHLHTNCSDGEGTPFEVACAYREIGCDFMVVTDHHKYWPSVQAQEEVSAVTDAFTVIRGEEIHNMDMGYFHIINMGGNTSVNEIIENNDAYVQAEVEKILAERDFEGLASPRSAAFRIFAANEIRKGGGVAILPHPFWHIGEYNTQTEEVIYHFRHGDYDALEVLAACDYQNNGSNLQELLRVEMIAEGIKVPVVGSSDAHYALSRKTNGLFGIQFTLVFAESPDDILDAVKEERAVAINRTDDVIFHAVGRYRYAKYARFLMAEYFPAYTKLTEKHAAAMAKKDAAALREIEAEIDAFKHTFFAV